MARLLVLFATLLLMAGSCRDGEPPRVEQTAPAERPSPPAETRGAGSSTATPTASTITTGTPRPASTATPAVAFTPRFSPGACPFKVGAGQTEGRSVICGTVDVPEEHARPGGPVLTLAVARFPATGANPQPEPLVWLDGGPGGPSLSGTGEELSTLVSRLFTQNRDLILFDQRGTGYSRPALNCTENIDLKYRALAQRRTPEQIAADDVAAITACRGRLRAQGVNLSAFTSAENAADVNDIRLALGYRQINLYGVSYGTRLALTVMRDFPSILRSVVLDSTVPLQSNLYIEVAANAQRSFDTLFDGCAADRACASAYPDLRKVFAEQANRLNADPVTITVTHPRSGRRYDFLLTGDQFVAGLFQALYRADLIPVLPKVIFGVRDGNYEPFANAIRDNLFYDDLSHGMYYSVQCGEELAFASLDQVNAAASRVQPEIGRAISGTADNASLFTVCSLWDARRAAPVENVAVSSSVPTLVLAGQYDPITPPAWGRLAAATLDRATFLEFPGVGHGAMVSALCPLEVAAGFLNQPDASPDATCISRMTAPRWQT